MGPNEFPSTATDWPFPPLYGMACNQAKLTLPSCAELVALVGRITPMGLGQLRERLTWSNHAGMQRATVLLILACALGGMMPCPALFVSL